MSPGGGDGPWPRLGFCAEQSAVAAAGGGLALAMEKPF